MNSTTNQIQSLHAPQLQRVLVVIDPDLVKPGAPKESALITKAIAFAQATGCELEFFHVSQNDSLGSGLFSDDEEVRREQEKQVDADATGMAELVLRLNSEGVKIKYDTRYDSSRTEAILRKIDEAQPDLVMKQSRDHNYVMGLLGNTDWDLIRQSPAHVWFVTDEGGDRVENLLTAVGASENENEIVAEADYEVFRFANLIADSFMAKNTPVHAYQVPTSLTAYAAYRPTFGGVGYPPASVGAAMHTSTEIRQKIARDHGRSIEAFAEFFHIEPGRVRVGEGRPQDVLATAATDLDADLIVMAARNLSRWERWSKALTAEPLLAQAPCDVVFIKDSDTAPVPAADENSLTGLPVYDLESAVMDPAHVFGSPAYLAQASEISVQLRNRLLEIWQQDVRAQMADDVGDGPVWGMYVNLLEAINTAQRGLVERRLEPVEALATH